MLALAIGVCLSAAAAAPPPPADLRALFVQTSLQVRQAGSETDRKRVQEAFIRELRTRAQGRELAAAATELLGKAVRMAMTDSVKALLDAGANPEERDHGATPIVIAAELPEPVATQIAAALLDHGAAVDATVERGPWDGETALTRAARRGNVPLVTFLLDHGADANHRMRGSGHTPLMAGAGYPAVARVLLDHGAMLNATDDYGRAPIIFAALAGCPEAVAFLRERGAHPNAPDLQGKTANNYLAEFSKDGVPTGVCAPKQ